MLLGAEDEMTGIKPALALFGVFQEVVPAEIPVAELPELEYRRAIERQGLAGGEIIHRPLDKGVAGAAGVLDEKDRGFDDALFLAFGSGETVNQDP